MVDWAPVERGKGEVLGELQEGIVTVRLPLSQHPPGPWVGFFNDPTNIAIPASGTPPRIVGQTVELSAPTAKLREHLGYVDDRIRQANERYATEVIPAIDRAERQRQADETARQQRIADAQRLLDEM